MFYKSKRKVCQIILALGCVACLYACNPFAPAFEPLPAETENVLGNRQTIQGFFEYFRNAYELRDSTLYGQLLAPQFRFTFFNFTNNIEEFWTRDIEMQTTYNMFKNVKTANLQWNNYIVADTVFSDTLASVERNFNLSITDTDQTIIRSTGIARIALRRKNKTDPWRIISWYDKSDF